MDTVAECERATEALEGQSVWSGEEIRHLIETFAKNGIYYRAKDTRRFTGNDMMATLIYTCAHHDCPSSIKLTVTHSIVSNVECNWDHTHAPMPDQPPRNLCSVCQEAGHNRRTCPLRRGEEDAGMGQLSDSNKDLIISGLKIEGWRLLGRESELRDLRHYVELQDNALLVRKFFYFAPNDASGVEAKLDMYGNIFRKCGSVAESFQGNTEYFLECSSCTFIEVASMAYALIWYAHYAVVILGSDVGLFETMKTILSLKNRSLSQGGFHAEVHIPKAAIEEGMLILGECLKIITAFREGVLHVDGMNIHEVERSLIPRFLRAMHLHSGIEGGTNRPVIKALWTLEMLIIDQELLMHSPRTLVAMPKTAKIIASD